MAIPNRVNINVSVDDAHVSQIDQVAARLRAAGMHVDRTLAANGSISGHVTGDLDEGPIIDQSVERVTHAMGPEDYVAVGRDIESRTLARAVKWHCEHRILLNGKKTVTFS